MKIPEIEDAEEAERHKVAKMLVGQRLAGGIPHSYYLTPLLSNILYGYYMRRPTMS